MSKHGRPQSPSQLVYHCDKTHAAKAYISKLRQTAEAFGDDDLGVSEQLAADAATATGRLTRQLAHKIQLPDVTPEAGLYGSGKLVRASRLSTTAVALSSDDSKAFSVSKCGSVTIWDIESSSRCAPLHPHHLHTPGHRSMHTPLMLCPSEHTTCLPHARVHHSQRPRLPIKRFNK